MLTDQEAMDNALLNAQKRLDLTNKRLTVYRRQFHIKVWEALREYPEIRVINHPSVKIVFAGPIQVVDITKEAITLRDMDSDTYFALSNTSLEKVTVDGKRLTLS